MRALDLWQILWEDDVGGGESQGGKKNQLRKATEFLGKRKGRTGWTLLLDVKQRGRRGMPM